MTLIGLDQPLPGGTFEKYQPYLENEVPWAAYKSGVLLDIYFGQDRPAVAIILECELRGREEGARRLSLAKVGLLEFGGIPLGLREPGASVCEERAMKKELSCALS